MALQVIGAGFGRTGSNALKLAQWQAAAKGWEPLSRFLGVPVLDGSYPRANSTEAYLARYDGNAQSG